MFSELWTKVSLSLQGIHLGSIENRAGMIARILLWFSHRAFALRWSPEWI